MAKGFLIDFIEIKNFVNTLMDRWDERVLLPGLHEDIKTTIVGQTLELRFRDRFYAFPKNEFLILPAVNASVEELARLLAQDIVSEFKTQGITSVEVEVEESLGQSAVWSIEI